MEVVAEPSPPNRSLAEEQYAQKMLLSPEHCADLRQEYTDSVLQSEQYQSMVEHDQPSALKWIARLQRKPVFAALVGHAVHNVMHEIVPFLEEGGELCRPREDRAYELKDYEQTSDVSEITGTAANYLFSLLHHLDKGWQKVLVDADTPGHPCAYLMEELDGIQTSLRSIDPNYITARESCHTNPRDNAIVTLELLTRSRIEYADATYQAHRVPSVAALTRQALHSADRLSWGTTASRAAVGIPMHTSRLSEHFSEIEAYDPTIPAQRIAERSNLICPYAENGEFGFAHKSLAEKPWDWARRCAALPITMPEEADRDIARRFQAYCYRYEQVNPAKAPDRQNMDEEWALVHPGQFVLQFGSLIGRETIFKDWPNKDVYEANAWPQLSVLV